MYKLFITVWAMVCLNMAAQACNCGGIPNVWMDASGNNASANAKFQISILSDYKNFNLNMPMTAHVHTHEHVGAAKTSEADELLKATLFSNLSLRYNLNKKYTIVANLPYLLANGLTNKVHAFADASLIGIRNFAFNNELYVGVGAGVKFVSGSKMHNISSELLVPNTGSYDPMLIANAQKSFGKVIVKTDALFRYATGNNSNIYYGNYTYSTFSVGYNFSTKNNCEIPDSTISKQVMLFAGIMNERFGQVIEQNVINASSGGNITYGNLTAIVSYKNITFSAAYLQPLVQTLNGAQQKINYRLRTSLSINF